MERDGRVERFEWFRTYEEALAGAQSRPGDPA
jgi:hypothetical protein